MDRGPLGPGTSLKSGRTDEGNKVNCAREWCKRASPIGPACFDYSPTHPRPTPGIPSPPQDFSLKDTVTLQA